MSSFSFKSLDFFRCDIVLLLGLLLNWFFIFRCDVLLFCRRVKRELVPEITEVSVSRSLYNGVVVIINMCALHAITLLQLTGALLSFVAFLVMAFLVWAELSSFLTITTESRLVREYPR